MENTCGSNIPIRKCNWCPRNAVPRRMYCPRCQVLRDDYYAAKLRRDEQIPDMEGNGDVSTHEARQ